MRLLVILVAFVTACIGAAPPEPEPSTEQEGADDSDDKSDTATISATVGTTARVVNTGGIGLRLRTAASSTASVILVMPEGAFVNVIAGPSGAWYRVTYNGSTGWAHGDYLRTWKGGANNLLPWTANVSFAVTQDHNHGSHLNFDRWAWDFGTPVGTPILAAHFGTVRLVRGDSTRGGCSSSFAGDANYVVIDQGNGYESLYLHLESVTVTKGQLVERGDRIGYSGQTGWSCGAHLHFAVQLSPTNGGGPGWYNQSIHDYFYDPGFAFDPAEGTVVKSQNGVSNQP